jgi:hypothetical protein
MNHAKLLKQHTLLLCPDAVTMRRRLGTVLQKSYGEAWVEVCRTRGS